MVWLATGRVITLAKPLVAGLVMRGLPGPKTSRCLLLGLGVRLILWVLLLALTTLSDVVARTMGPCRPLILALPPRSPRATFP